MTDVMFFKTLKGNQFRVNCDNIDLRFFRVPGVPDRPLICAPNRGRNDWRYGVLNKITQNGYRAISRHGNYFNVKAWLAEKTKPQLTNMIVGLRDGTCTSYEDAMKRWPVPAFRHFRGVQNLLQETKHKARRVEEVIGTQPFRLLTENQLGKFGRDRAVHTLICDFINQKFVHQNDHKRYTGLWIFSAVNSVGKSALMKTLADISRMYFHKYGDNQQQDDFDTNGDIEFRYHGYVFDGLQSAENFNLMLAENICDSSVKIGQRFGGGAYLPQRTALLVTSNLSPQIMFPPHVFAMINERFTIVNLQNTHLFDLVNHIRQVHQLPPYVAPVHQPPPNML